MQRSHRLLSVVLTCLLAVPAAFAKSQASNSLPAPIFPTVTSYSLDKTRITLPSGLAGQFNLLLLSFEQEQQQQIESWMPAAEAIQHTHFAVHYYQVPVFQRENALYRWWENSSMRSDQTDPEMWPWIVPLYVDEQPFLRALEIPDRKEIQVLLVDKAGHVLWRSAGMLTTEKRLQLESAITQATEHQF